jgi:hypothetical protein
MTSLANRPKHDTILKPPEALCCSEPNQVSHLLSFLIQQGAKQIEVTPPYNLFFLLTNIEHNLER